MPRRAQWDWERHLTAEEAERLAAVHQESSDAHDKLAALADEERAITQRATERAKAAKSKRPPFVL